jgi:uncharacterized phage-associated protein
MKLQKLVYFAHGWWLALTGEPLVDEPIEAWNYGPVIPSVYHQFKHFGSENIDSPALDMTLEGKQIRFKEFSLNCPDDNTISFLNRIWDVYSPHSAIELSNMTHINGSPWKTTMDTAKHEGKISTRNCIIDNDTIRKYFTGIMDKNNGKS